MLYIEIRTQDTVRVCFGFTTAYQRGQNRTETPSGVAIAGQLFLGKYPSVSLLHVARCRRALPILSQSTKLRDTVGYYAFTVASYRELLNTLLLYSQFRFTPHRRMMTRLPSLPLLTFPSRRVVQPPPTCSRRIKSRSDGEETHGLSLKN